MEHTKTHKRSFKSRMNSLYKEIREARHRVIHFKSNDVINRILFSSIVLAIIAIAILVMTLLIPVSANVNALAIYLRNGLSLALFVFTGSYLLGWCRMFIGELKRQWILKSIALFTSLIAIIRGIFSILVIIYMTSHAKYSVIYYASDAFASLTLAFFIIVFSKSILFTKHSSHSKSNCKKLTLSAATIFLVNVIVTAAYTLLNYSPKGLAWLYYVCCLLAWLIICVCFFLFAHSRFVDRKTMEAWRIV